LYEPSATVVERQKVVVVLFLMSKRTITQQKTRSFCVCCVFVFAFVWFSSMFQLFLLWYPQPSA
jgi:hypothetical protein